MESRQHPEHTCAALGAAAPPPFLQISKLGVGSDRGASAHRRLRPRWRGVPAQAYVPLSLLLCEKEQHG